MQRQVAVDGIGAVWICARRSYIAEVELVERAALTPIRCECELKKKGKFVIR